MFSPEHNLSSTIRNKFFIDGEWVSSGSNRRVSLVNPATEAVHLELPLADDKTIDNAVAAARHAFDHGPWPRVPAKVRADYIQRLTDALSDRVQLMADLWTFQVGAPISLTTALAHVGVRRIGYYANLAREYAFEETRPTERGTARIRREAVGVAVLIVPWNATFPILAQKLGAALAAGCTCIVKSSPESPLDALVFAECAEIAGFPPGVINVVTADRDESIRLVQSKDIDKISFTGSFAAGSQIAATAAAKMNRFTMELGGKSAAILLEDADLEAVLPILSPLSMPFSGQFCFAQSRIIVPFSRKDEVVARFSDTASSLAMGDPWCRTTQIGPVLNKRQQDRIQGFIQSGVDQGARIASGEKRDDVPKHGFFVNPTVFDDVTPDMAIAREEIFGPVVTIQGYDTIDQAIRLANNTDLGLSGTVFSQNVELAYDVACQIRTGQVGINGLDQSPALPFGGYKMSGTGREGGPEGLEAFLETKAIMMPAAG